MKLFRILDPFTATLITVVLLASFFPARGAFVPFFEHLTTAAIALLFFMHGAKLSREAIIAGGSHWRLHLWVMCSTFILFPLLGVLFAWWASLFRSVYETFPYSRSVYGNANHRCPAGLILPGPWRFRPLL
ncbi:hypothetical protein NUBL2888_18330 [Klebsiella pneumoniae]|nr:hypothetical protein NUBL2888_18330 [Klebsiella pneumoniae]